MTRTPESGLSQSRPQQVGRFVPAFLVVIAACGSVPQETGPRTVRPGAPGEPTRPAAAAGTVPGRAAHVQADVEFMQSMIAHHAQALDMTALVPVRSGRDDIRLLARRIEASQADEMAWMERWLQARGEAATGAGHGAHGHGTATDSKHAAGMLTTEELARLAAASGGAFDRLFVESMIRHHEGALAMVETLFEVPGAGREPELFQFASHVDADQRMEIARMRRLLDTELQ